MTKTRVRYGMSLVYALAGSAILLLLVTVLASAGDGGARKIIVFHDGASQSEMMATTKIVGARMVHDLSFINAIAMELSPEAEVALAKDPRVLRIDDDPELDWLAAVDEPVEIADSDSQIVTWNILRVGALSAQEIADGEDVKVVVIDTGIATYHDDLDVAGGKSFVAYTDKYDDDYVYSHGTHVAGILAARRNSIGVIGVAPGVRLYAAKALNFMGWGYLSDVVAAINWSIKIKARVINMSLGTYTDFPTLHAAVRKAYDADIAVVCAGGNNYGGELIYPAKYDESNAVLGTDSKNQPAYFSSAGPEADITAPAQEILSTYVDVPIRKPGYAKMSGTSMASPHVAGAVALLISSDPGRKWTPKLLKKTLQLSAKDFGAPGPDYYFGAGLLNVNKAVRTKK